MGTSFVTLERDVNGIPTSDINHQVGFWMRDSMLELWLRLMVLNAGEPKSQGLIAIRNQWFLASQDVCSGCIPTGLDTAAATPEGFVFMKTAVENLSAAVCLMDGPLTRSALDLLGCGGWQRDIEIEDLMDIAAAFLDLVNFNVSSTASTEKYVPGRRQPGILPR